MLPGNFPLHIPNRWFGPRLGVPLKSHALSANLDILRAIAVLSVFVGHFAVAAFHDRDYSSLGRFGVILFLVHTSYVLMGSLRRLTQAHPPHRSLVSAFWVRRIFRIYPLSIFAVLFVVALRIPPYSVILWFCFDKMEACPSGVQIAALVILWISVPILLYRGIEKPWMRKGAALGKRILESTPRHLVGA